MTNGQIPWDAQSGEQPAAGMGQQQAPQDIQPAAPQQYGQPADQSFPQPPLPADPQYRQPVQQPGYAQPAEQSGYAAPAPQPGYAQPTQPVPAQATGYAYPQQDYAQQQYYAQPTQPVPAAAPAPGYGAYGTPSANNAPYPVKPKMNTMAVVGFIFSFLISIVGLILCIIAKNQIKTRGERGDGLATAGIIISMARMVLAGILRMSMGSSSDTYSSTVLLPMLPVSVRTLAIVTGAVIVVAVGVGRVALNVHHPSDVLAGWALGYLYYLLCVRLVRPAAAPSGGGD